MLEGKVGSGSTSGQGQHCLARKDGVVWVLEDAFNGMARKRIQGTAGSSLSLLLNGMANVNVGAPLCPQ